MLHIKKLQQAVAIALFTTTAVVGTTTSVSYGMDSVDLGLEVIESCIPTALRQHLGEYSSDFETVYDAVEAFRKTNPSVNDTDKVRAFTKEFMKEAKIFSFKHPQNLPVSTLIHYYKDEINEIKAERKSSINELILALNNAILAVTSETSYTYGKEVAGLDHIRVFNAKRPVAQITKNGNVVNAIKEYVYENLLYPFFGDDTKAPLTTKGWLKYGILGNTSRPDLTQLLEKNTEYSAEQLHHMLRASYWLDMGLETIDANRTAQGYLQYYAWMDKDVNEKFVPEALKLNRELRQNILAMLAQKDEKNFKQYVKRSEEKVERRTQMLESFKNKQDKIILSLDGGGMRGLVHTEMLKEMEKEIRNKTKNPNARIQDYIDGVTGTSTGGLIAFGLTAEDPFFPGECAYNLDDIEAIYTTHGKTIFPTHYEGFNTSAGSVFNQILQGTFKITHQNTFGSGPLEGVLFGLLGPSRMSDALMPMMVATHDAITKELFPISNFDKTTHHFPTLYAARATSAAPTYLPPIIINGIAKKPIALVDGGIGYNNPSLEFVNHIVRCNTLYEEKQSFNVLSMGTTLFPKKIDYKSNENAAALVGGFFLGSMDTAVTKAHTDLSNLFTSYHKGSTVVRWNPINDKEIDLAATDEDTLNGLKNLVTGWTNYFSAPDTYEGSFQAFSEEMTNKKEQPAYVSMAMDDMLDQFKEQQEAYKNIFGEDGWIDRAIQSKKEQK